MQPTATNGQSTSTQLLDSVRQAIERLEAEVARQQQENQQLRAERDEALFMVEQWKQLMRDLPEWERLDRAQYSATIDDILTELHAN